ncbi:hypothetical protein CBL_00227 [Carabus blaptoides fortunei]
MFFRWTIPQEDTVATINSGQGGEETSRRDGWWSGRCLLMAVRVTATRESHDRDVYSVRSGRDSKMDPPSSIDHSTDANLDAPSGRQMECLHSERLSPRNVRHQSSTWTSRRYCPVVMYIRPSYPLLIPAVPKQSTSTITCGLLFVQTIFQEQQPL